MRVVIADSALLVRAGLAHLVQAAGIEIVGEAGDPETMLRKVRGHRPDVVVLDAALASAARTLRGEHADLGLLLLSDRADPRHLAELGAAGVGYLLKARIGEPERLTDAIHTVARGGSVLDPDVVDRLLERRRRQDPFGALTGREREVLEAMSEGESNRGIARRLFVSERAVERHITAIFAKLGMRAREDAHRRVLAVLAYLQAA
jgi:DNA-binding NarL/FixJ family response regulator